MGIRDVTGEVAIQKFLGAFYGNSGEGKTNLATAYPDEWGRGLYFALDPDAHRLESVMPQFRDRLTVLKFDGDDPISNMSSIVTDPLDKFYPGHGVVIVDTLTTGAKAMLQDAANRKYFKGKEGDGHITFGPKDAAITQAIPSISDYGGAKWLVENWLNLLVANVAPKYHVIVLCHEDYDSPKKEEAGRPDIHAIGGPATFGRKLLSEFPVWFPTIVRLAAKSRTDLNNRTTTRFYAYASKQGDYIARIREGLEGGNPMSVVELNRSGRNWWDLYVNHFMKGAA